jgi:hypothetical protein
MAMIDQKPITLKSWADGDQFVASGLVGQDAGFLCFEMAFGEACADLLAVVADGAVDVEGAKRCFLRESDVAPRLTTRRQTVVEMFETGVEDAFVDIDAELGGEAHEESSEVAVAVLYFVYGGGASCDHSVRLGVAGCVWCFLDG